MDWSRKRWILATAVCWLAAPDRLLAVEVTGNLDLAAFTADAMSTTRSRLERGSVRFEFTQSTMNHYLRVAGLWVWEGERDHFRGTVEKQRPGADTERGRPAAPPRRCDLVPNRRRGMFL